mmetsp:Transcript_24623/g.53090  ORF Transcript_24623/g.53090 Transcript_24623/m.53090 type:complete len:226 (+) Transcript_24623:1260-1937(+)
MLASLSLFLSRLCLFLCIRLRRQCQCEVIKEGIKPRTIFFLWFNILWFTFLWFTIVITLIAHFGTILFGMSCFVKECWQFHWWGSKSVSPNRWMMVLFHFHTSLHIITEQTMILSKYLVYHQGARYRCTSYCFFLFNCRSWRLLCCIPRKKKSQVWMNISRCFCPSSTRSCYIWALIMIFHHCMAKRAWSTTCTAPIGTKATDWHKSFGIGIISTFLPARHEIIK